MILGVAFDLDGVLVDSEQLWDEARRGVATEHGGRWRADATAAMQGMSSVEWATYMHDQLGVHLDTRRISQLVVDRLVHAYERHVPTLPGALDAVRRIGARWPLALASSANRVVIDKVLDLAGLTGWFRATVSSEEVAHGKPRPDVYLEAARRLGVHPERCCAVEDSANGIRAAVAAPMRVVAVPNRRFPPPESVLDTADAVIATLDDLTPELIDEIDP